MARIEISIVIVVRNAMNSVDYLLEKSRVLLRRSRECVLASMSQRNDMLTRVESTMERIRRTQAAIDRSDATLRNHQDNDDDDPDDDGC